MPRRADIESVLILGSGPIVIGQACEFDYSGTQACKVLKEEGLKVVLVNSNPATIMTDPNLVDRTYIEPITPDVVEQVIARERPDACLATLGGQTALNVAVALADRGVFDRYGVELIGAGIEAIKTGEDRRLFRAAMEAEGLDLPRSGYAYSIEDAEDVALQLGLPVIVRPSFVLGGGGSGIAKTLPELLRIAREGLDLSPISEVLVEESVEGWKEFELEVMRDRKDNFVVVCSIENFDPMGIHTGDSITVAPAQTLTDVEYQLMRDAAARIIRRIGVETGGSNIQFAVDPVTGRMVVIEMNPRVSRSSALASKATGFPIAKMAAKLAIGYTLDEIPNDITLQTPASFEPSIDYVVVKVPRWAFEKFPDADQRLETKMKSVGEAMAIGRTFTEALQKAVRSTETDRGGVGADGSAPEIEQLDSDELRVRLKEPHPDRLILLEKAIRSGIDADELHDMTGVDPWFLSQLSLISDMSAEIQSAPELTHSVLHKAKRRGFSDRQIGYLRNLDEAAVHSARLEAGITPTFKSVDTCAAEFEAYTPYYYSTFEEEDEVFLSDQRSIVILGSGPNRIGQGIEFDYCCVHAAFACKEAGYDAVMINCNPETVSTDYDTSTRLYFEPLTFEDVMAVVERENPHGLIISLGGQTPLKLAGELAEAGVPILGTAPDAIDAAEDRGRFTALLTELEINQAPGGIASSPEQAREVARAIGYPVLIRPSYVLGGRAMEIAYSPEMLDRYITSAVDVSPKHPVLIDRFLEGAVEVDVDAIFDGVDLYIGGILEHIEEAGVHSGDSACVLPPYSIGNETISEIVRATDLLARALEVKGLINVQFAVRDGVVYCLEVNPRASRTVPFVGKATGVPLAKVATRVMLGEALASIAAEGATEGGSVLPPYKGISDLPTASFSGSPGASGAREGSGSPGASGAREGSVSGGDSVGRGAKKQVWWGMDGLEHVAVKEAVLPFSRFPGVDIILGPEMKSTGEVMGIDRELGAAFAKSQAGGGWPLPTEGTVFISVADKDKRAITFPAKRLDEMGFRILATEGTAESLRRSGVDAETVTKLSEGAPNIVDRILAGDVDLVINTPFGKGPRSDGYHIRTAAVRTDIPCITTLPGVQAAVQGIEAARSGSLQIRSLQEYLSDAGRGPR